MRQSYSSIEKTGTDHNALNNTVLVGGKGIRCGQVIGERDFRTSQENLSQAHLKKDSSRIKFMGKAFDFKKQEVSQEKPVDYKIEDYLNSQSIVNTMLHLFGVSKDQHLKLSNSVGAAPILKNLLR